MTDGHHIAKQLSVDHLVEHTLTQMLQDGRLIVTGHHGELDNAGGSQCIEIVIWIKCESSLVGIHTETVQECEDPRIPIDRPHKSVSRLAEQM
jgi:hypothetical protein